MPSAVDTGEASPFALSPLIGFKSITAPSVQVETFEINAGNQPFPMHVPKSAKTENITLSRGVRVGDDEFFRWIKKAIYGRGTYHRDLLLLQIHSPYASEDVHVRHAEVAAYGVGAATMFSKPYGGAVAAAATVGALATAGFSNAVVAARAWMLHHCMPVSYKSSNDFDSEDISFSVQELELEVEYFEEVSFGPPSLSSVTNAGVNAVSTAAFAGISRVRG